MKKIFRSTSLILLLSLSYVVTQAQDRQQVQDVSRDKFESRDKAERNTAPFNPLFFKNKQAQHIAVKFQVLEGGRLRPVSAQVRAGKMPHRFSGGKTVVSYRDEQGKELGRFSMHDPTMARSYEGNEGNIRYLPPGSTFELALPYLRNIFRLEISGLGPQLSSQGFELGNIIKEALEKERKE